MDINGTSPERYVASLLLTDSNLKGKEYYRKEDKYTQIIRENAPLLFEGEVCSLDWHNEQVMILKDEADQLDNRRIHAYRMCGKSFPVRRKADLSDANGRNENLLQKILLRISQPYLKNY